MMCSFLVALAVFNGAVRAYTGCETKADVQFLIDSSDNVGKENFDKQLHFISDVANNLQIAPDKVQVGALTYGSSPSVKFQLDRYADKAGLQNAILGIIQSGGQPKLAEAIRYATTTTFSPSSGGRFDSSHVIVLLTSQPSGSIDTVRLASKTAQDDGIIIYTIGIGTSVNANELHDIASDPDSRHMFTAENFDALGSLGDLLATKICSELPPNPSLLSAPTGCLQKADVVFLLDSSSSVGISNFQKLENFLKDVTSKVDVASDKVQIGMVKYGSYPSVEFSLTQHTSRPAVMKAVEAMTYLGGGTNDADAIRYTGQQIFSQNAGARGEVPRIAVVITDGGSSDANAAVVAADKMRQQNIGVIVVGVGPKINEAELSRVADSPATSNLLKVQSYNDLATISNKLIEQMCKVNATQPSLTGVKLPADPCMDHLTNCDQYGADTCASYQQWSRANCARTCGFCSPLYTVAPQPCADSISSCTSQSITECTKPGSFVYTNCQRFCGLCGSNTSSTGYFGKCFYKNKAYVTGEKWLDGCDYECVCEDGNTGRYKCYNRCPVYQNLPKDCTLVTKPGECCLQPVCNFSPVVNVQQSSGHAVTASGIDVCVYRGKQYYERQSWRDGCDYQCSCIDAKTGLFQCDDLCPTYNSIPPYCHLEQPAGECCKKPVCEFDTHSGSFTGSGSISGYGIDKLAPENTPCRDIETRCSEYGKEACVNFRGWALINCRKFCDFCDDGSAPAGPGDHCVHEGKLYSEGESWNTSCHTVCTCENAKYGYYRCTDTCPSYNNLAKDCQVIQPTGACCPVVQCQAGYYYSSSVNPALLGNGALISVVHPPNGMTYVSPTQPTGGAMPIGAGNTGYTPPVLGGCLYKGQVYVQNQAWEDGCEFSCICKDAASGLYSCKHKCPSYPALSASCQLVTDRNDECCKSPQCSVDPVTQLVPVPLPVFRPATQTHSAVKPPGVTDTDYGHYSMTIYLAQTGLTPPPPTAPAVVPAGGIGYCVYNGKQYKQGDLWEDGCDFNCICQDASKGHYSCVEKCVHYGVLPDHCYLKTDPVNPCCDVPVCNIPVNFGGHYGELTTTVKPKGEECVYEGVSYQQGQTWYDGCSFKCTCEDAANNVYRCLSRCLEYENIGESCRFVPDPRDPGCCQMPQCPTTGPTLGTNIQVTPAIPGKYTGHSLTVGYCEYKGVHYNQDERWTDGCDLDCQCVDAQSGFFRCSERCPQYVNLPAYCNLATDFTNPCCQTPRCIFPSSTQAVTGAQTTGTTLIPTPTSPGQTPAMVTGTQPTPTYNFCVYKGVQYSEGQSWEDGCDYKCACDNAKQGLYTCRQRCADYRSHQDGCSLVTDPRDSCCLVPYCVPQQVSTSQAVPTAQPVSTSQAVPTAQPVPTSQAVPTAQPVSTSQPIPSSQTVSGSPQTTQYMIPVPVAGNFTGVANRPTLQPNSTLPPLNYCEYKGQQYKQQEKWDDGCDYMCQCVDASTGRYVCTEKCPPYVNLPVTCRLVRDAANPCCQKPVCPSMSPQPTNTLSTDKPPLTSPVYIPTNVCVYKMSTYTQGQQWYDGCDYVCNCEDSNKGLYTCNDRCPSYTNLPSECTLVPSRNDPLCCKEPKCLVPTGSRNDTTGYFIPPTLPTGEVTGAQAKPATRWTMVPSPSVGPSGMSVPATLVPPNYQSTPTSNYQSTLSPNYGSTLSPPQYQSTLTPVPYSQSTPGLNIDNTTPTNPNPTPAYCVYKGNTYLQGQKWQDGCDYTCECLNAVTGQYRCVQMCPKYDTLPALLQHGCQFYTDPYNPCCKIPYCLPVPEPVTPPVAPTGSTLVPPSPTTPAPGCMYNGVRFNQGQQWTDGCDLQCICEDETTGHYKCRDRCNTFDVPIGCTLETDPADACCKVPNCPVPTMLTPGTIPPYSGPTPLYGSTISPPLSPTPITLVPVTGKFDVYPVAGNQSGCTDQGVIYKAGDTWQQGCKYNCACLDNTGRYQCKDRCPLYKNIPSYCRLEMDPNDVCCKVPKCQIPTYAPPTQSHPSPQTSTQGQPSPGTVSPSSPVSGTTPAYSSGTTPSNSGTTPGHQGSTPSIDVTSIGQITIVPSVPTPTGCRMDGQVYVQGQSWYRDCSQKCVCEDGTTGLYRCYDRCIKYPSIPANCTLVTDPVDPACCQVPQCIPVPVPNQTPPTGPPVMVTGVTGVITGVLPLPTGGTTGTRNVCVYKDRSYTQGQKWQDGCDYNCECTDGHLGQYKCTQRCATFPIVPPQCTMKRNMADLCCFVPVCDFSKVPPLIPPVVSPPQTNGSVSVPPPLQHSFCVYRGVAYRQGQTWDIGCEKKCRCDDADNNIYTCFDRCSTYNNLGAGCVMLSDPLDSCCQIPDCTKVPTPFPPTVSPTPHPPSGPTSGPTPYPPSGSTVSPTPHPPSGPTAGPTPYPPSSGPTGGSTFYPPSGQTAGPTPYPPSGPTVSPPNLQSVTPTLNPSQNPTTVCTLPMPTAVPGVIMGGPQPDSNNGPLGSNIGYCEYKGRQYRQGESWQDGCSYMCICIDASSGQYQCQERCPRYVNLPAYCQMIQDPDNNCCTKPQCNICPPSTMSPTPVPVTGMYSPTPTAPPKGVCVMDGKQYSDGQKWFVGCEKMCVCNDGKTGAYSCYDRCPTYQTPAGCRLVPDPRDPTCCQVPDCPGSTVIPIYGNTTGYGTPPTPVGSSPRPEMCVYKGRMYGQGQRWQDGCQYDCICDNATSGHFLCTQRCPNYPNLPASCYLEQDPANPCCQKPVCLTAPATPTPGPDGKTPSVSPYITPPTEFCVYQGVPMRQGQTVNQGCDKVCKCEDASTGRVTCTDRCPTFPALSPDCSLVTDPRDECCQAPLCIDKGNHSNITGALGSVYGFSVPNNNQFTGFRDGCVYGGKIYTQGQTWDDGCSYRCQCLDAAGGKYRCTQICPQYPALPSYCVLSQDPANKCCQKPDCQPYPVNQIRPSASPNTTSTVTGSVVPVPRGVCVYKGSTYQQGQQWFDGCEFLCQCDDAENNLYSCSPRCPEYSNIPQGCLLVPDPKDPTCCQRPSCPIPPQPTVGIISVPQPLGTITGTRPLSVVGPGHNVTEKSGCVYKGTLVYQGQRFDDGCDYECVCMDNVTGKYQCTEKCTKYTSLPRECILVQDPQKPCCQVPYCDFKSLTPFPTGYPTPSVLVSPTPLPNVVVVKPYVVPSFTNTNKPGNCVYKSAVYGDGVTWYDGCERKCTCENSTIGYYTCSQRCPVYPPTSCPLRTDPRDSCCLIPDCNKIPDTVYPTGFSNQSTISPVIRPTPLTGGTFTGQLIPYQTGSSFYGSSNACVYKGVVYKQSETWKDGCNYNCECLDASRGQYRCTDRCPRYPFLPPTCHTVPSRTDVCCSEVECLLQTTTTTAQSVTPTVKQPVSVSPSLPPVPKECVLYNGMRYPQNASWIDGCTECQCDNAATNTIYCHQRCPIYSGLPSFCTLVDNPADRCCKMPSCIPTNGITLTPVAGNTTFSNNSLSVLPVGTHTVFSGYGKPVFGSGTINGNRSVCVYKGSVYSQDQAWEDGCDYVCSCENATLGMYRCAAKCPDFPALPSYCKMMAVPGQCCKTVVCDIPGYGVYHPGVPLTNSTWANYTGGFSGNGTIISVPGIYGFISGSNYPGGGYYLPNATQPEVLTNLRDKCIYKNHLYNQGEIWNIDCDYRCECVDSLSGYYVCKQLCPVYSNLPSNICYLVKNADQCCSEPRCMDHVSGQYVNPFNSSTEFPVVGTYSGGFSGFRPVAYSGFNQFTGSQRAGCYYKGSVYKENENWEDGCEFSCTCLNQTSGLYSCSPKCSSYTRLPAMCHLVSQPGSCCQVVDCPHRLPIEPTLPPVTVTRPPTQCPGLNPYCYDRLDNCREYGTQACFQPYVPWAKRNCPFTCGYCDCSQHPSQTVCEDKLPDCKDFGKSSCSGIYESWARENCPLFCGFCPNVTTTTTAAVETASLWTVQPVATQEPCEDKLPTCAFLDTSYYCTGVFQEQGYENCRKTCNLCPTAVPSAVSVSATLPPAGSSVTTERVTTVPLPEQACNYKGVLHGQSQTWIDGLKSCTCVDASVGYFKCTDRCPNYDNVPPACSITQVPGACPEVHCPIGVTYKPSNVTVNVNGMCEYKGQYYLQDQTWNDGCRQACRCTDASSGLYSCRSVCLNWNNLPSQCHLEDAPVGMCCQQPKCPDNFFISVPLAYKDQYPGYPIREQL